MTFGVLKKAGVSGGRSAMCWSRAANLGASVAALDAQLVDLALSDVGSFFSFVQLVLELTELAQVNVGLLLL